MPTHTPPGGRRGGRSGALAAFGFGCAIAVVLLYGGELWLRLSAGDPGLAAIEAAAEKGRPFDARTRGQVVAALRAQGRGAVPRLVPSGLLEEAPDGSLRSRLFGAPAHAHAGSELLPLGGISSRTTVLCNETGEWAVYEADEHGFRNPKGLWDLAPVDLLLLGDSFTIGECVAPGETIADRLREATPETLNLGYSGNSPLFELATLSEYGPQLKPRLTLWLYFENDLSWFDLGRSRRSPLLMRYLEEESLQGLAERQPEIDAQLEALLDSELDSETAQPDAEGPVAKHARSRKSGLEELRAFAALRGLRARLALLRGAAREVREAPDYALLLRVLARARSVVAGWQGELVVVYLPGVWNFDPHSRGPAFADPEAREQVESTAKSLGLGFVDLQEAFAAHPDPLSLYSYRGDSALGSPHMNADGYALVARVLEQALEPLLEPEKSAQPSARRSQISRQ